MSTTDSSKPSFPKPAGYALYILSASKGESGLELLDNRELSFDTNCIDLQRVPLPYREDILKISDKYKTEEIRFMTTETKAIKVWTYEFKDFELYLDTRLEFKTVVRSVAICE
jgi:hypothetical protein